jgi:2-succinyl-5-enolpyruvyl-6-hydroxy-3-cyclohexene-1-carboxylate synthase
MSAPNQNTLWARTFVSELAASGVDTVCISPGSRSTPLTAAFDRHDSIETFSHLDERSAAYFALGRARRTGSVTPVVCTSGTAAANYHPAVIEASQARVPLLVLTADRPPELHDSGANQTVDQTKLYGDAVRWFHDIGEPEPTARKLRSLRTTAARSIMTATDTPAGPVHLNFSFRKPLEPTPVPGDIPDDLSEESITGRDGAFVESTTGNRVLDENSVNRIAQSLSTSRGLIVVGPMTIPGVDPEAVAAFAHASGFPVLADPLSGIRYGGLTRTTPIIGGYDGYLTSELWDQWPDPDVVLRFGASPTSKPLRQYLESTSPTQYLVDPAGEWREATFTATDIVVADPTQLLWQLSRALNTPGSSTWRQRWIEADKAHTDVLANTDSSAHQSLAATNSDSSTDDIIENTDGEGSNESDRWFCEGRILSDVMTAAPDPATIFVSNSMPVRDLDRFGSPTTQNRTVLGNRGASGIDGIISTALGAGSALATTEHLIAITGDLAYYHDMNGLAALERCDVTATIVLINNDGGGIFHKLPIESYDPPFTTQFVTPHGLDFEPTEDIYDLSFARVRGTDRDGFHTAFTEATTTTGSHVIEVVTDSESSHRVREQLHDRVIKRILDN